MKFSLFFILLLVLISYSSAQRCRGSPRNPSCIGVPDVGRRGHGNTCTVRIMWYYIVSARRCRPMRYLGCGGNNNRWCSRSDCERRCRR